MKRTQIPVPMQTQILIQTALTIVSLIVGITFFFFFTSAMALPFLFLTILAAANGCRIYRIAVLGHDLTLSGTVLSVERTAVLRRPKALLAEIDGKALRIVLRNRHKVLAEGGRIAVYVQDSTPQGSGTPAHQGQQTPQGQTPRASDPMPGGFTGFEGFGGTENPFF